MSLDILAPVLPESVTDATLVVWHKKTGDWVAAGENLADLETDKVILEVPAPESGILQAIQVQGGEIVVAGQILAQLEVREENPIPANSLTGTDKPVSPSVRRMLAETNLDSDAIKGSGKHGRILKTDVQDYIQQHAEDNSFNAAIDLTASTHIATDSAPISSITGSIGSLRPEQRVPMTRLRARIAERLLQAQQNAAMLTTFNEVNLKAVIDLRNQYKQRFEDKHAIKLGFMSFFVKASIEALKRFPAINASIDGNDIIYHGYYDIGIAVTTQRGLIVPILRDADQLDFAGIEKGIQDFGSKARTGSISAEDLSGGTFTITNGGIFGSMLSTPILNPPQCAILGMHAIKDRPVVENGEIVIRPIMYLALSYDHRLVDGKEAVQFLGVIKECLESPAHLLLNI